MKKHSSRVEIIVHKNTVFINDLDSHGKLIKQLIKQLRPDKVFFNSPCG